MERNWDEVLECLCCNFGVFLVAIGRPPFKEPCFFLTLSHPGQTFRKVLFYVSSCFGLQVCLGRECLSSQDFFQLV